MEADRPILKNRKARAEIDAEYWAALEKWMENVRSLTINCNFIGPGLPFPVPVGFPSFPFSAAGPQLVSPPVVQAPNFLFVNADRAQATAGARMPRPFVEHQIPPIWKRAVAELIDFVFLFFMKLVITFFAVDYFQTVNFDKYDISAALQGDEKIDYEMALEMTAELITLELIHRVIVCIYETMFIAQIGQNAGGATPGKSLMGLRVVSCEQCRPGPTNTTVRVYPAAPVSLRSSILRAFSKNLVLALVFPFCFPLFFNKFNRTGYDMICGSIVIEDTRPQMRR